MPNTAKRSGNEDIKSTLNRFQKTSTWKALESLLSLAKTEEQYDRQLEVMEYLMLNTPDSKDNPLNWLIDALASAIEAYENIHYPVKPTDPITALKYLMEEHSLKQSDLPEIGNQAKVSEILSGKRHLNTRQIKALSKRFGLSSAVFIG